VIRDIHALDVSLLTALEALLEERSVTRAAARLGVTQQGLSGRLARLRGVFGDPLFVRDGAGVAPTPAAEALRPLAVAALMNLRALVERGPFAPELFEGVVTLATSDYAAALALPRLMAKFRSASPGLRLAVRTLQSATLRADMRDGRIDLAMTTPAFAPEGLRSKRLFRERYVGAARVGHEIFDGPIDVARFCAFAHLLISPDRGDFQGATDIALASVGARRVVGLVVPTFSVAPAILAGCDLIAVVPERMILGLEATIRAFPTPIPVEGFDLVAYWPERLHRDPAHRWFRAACFASFEPVPPKAVDMRRDPK
jgi:DNA-binding transcriptional LysR family regulator